MWVSDLDLTSSYLILKLFSKLAGGSVGTWNKFGFNKVRVEVNR